MTSFFLVAESPSSEPLKIDSARIQLQLENVKVDCTSKSCESGLSDSRLQQFWDLMDLWQIKSQNEICSVCPCTIKKDTLQCVERSVKNFPIDIYKLCPELDIHEAKILNLSKQSIKEFRNTPYLKSFSKVEDISLKNNGLETIHDGTLDYFYNLKRINLQSNPVNK